MYTYQGFGLNIASEIEFPELLPADFSFADVTITWGKVPEKLESGQIVNRAFSSISKDEFLLNIKNICRYYAGYGNKIVAEPASGIDEHSVRLFLLGTVMAAILYQRGYIPFHTSGIIKDEKLVLFAGNSGAGKSTLLAALATKGYTIFTDDICVLQYKPEENKNVLGKASYPMIKLWEDAIDQFDSGVFNRDFKVRPQLPKYGQFFSASFHLLPMPVAKIFILVPRNVMDISIKKLDAITAFKQLEKHAYKYQLIANTPARTIQFSLLSRLVNQASVYEVARPATGSNVDLLCNALENLL